MNILLLSPNTKQTGGIQRYTNETMRALKQMDHIVNCIELSHSSLIQKIVFTTKALFLLARLRPNVIICMHINLSPICLFAQKIFSVPYIVVAHGTDAWNMSYLMRIRGVKNASTIISVSSFTANKLKQQISKIEKKIIIVPCPVDENKFYIKEKNKYLVQKYGCMDKKVLFTLSRLSKNDLNKGYERVISVIPKLIKYFPNILYIIGGTGDYVSELRNTIQELGLESYVKLAKYIPEHELIDYYNIADVFVMPSKQEGFGIVFLEALACGVPVIAGNSDGSRDAVLNEKTGILVDPDNVHELTNAIISVLRKNTAKHLINSYHLRSTTIQHYGFDRFTTRIHDVVNSVYSRRR